MNFAWNAWLPRSIQESFTCRKSTTWDRRLYFPSKGRRAEDFFALKNPMASAEFEPAKLGTKGQHATSRPPKLLRQVVCFRTRPLYPECGLNGWQGWAHLGGCLDAWKTRGNFSFPEIDRWFLGHPTHSTVFLSSRQLPKKHKIFPNYTENEYWVFQYPEPHQSQKQGHTFCKVMLIWVFSVYL